TFPQDGQSAEHCAINKNEQHALLALVSVRKTEDRSRDHHVQPHIAQESSELSLKIAAKNDLLNKACSRAHADPEKELDCTSRSQQVNRRLDFLTRAGTCH